MKKRLKILLSVITLIIIGIIIFVVILLNKVPEYREFKDVSCTSYEDCQNVDCSGIGKGVWYCDNDGFGVCGENNNCTCLLGCI